MKGQEEDDENENLIETQQKGLDHLLQKIKVVIFKVLFVLAKEEKTDDQMIYYYILASLDYVQMHSFPFNNKIIYIWKADSFLTNILNFVNVFSISTYVPNLSYFTLLVSVYVCLSAIILIILNIFYVSYSFSQNKFKFMWPVYLLRSVAYYFVTVLFLPITETLTSILSCYNEPTTNDYVIYGYNEIHIQCWQGWHTFHALVTLLFMIIFVIICVLVAYAFFEPGMTNGNRTARQDSNGEVSFILNKVVCQLMFCFLGENQSWVLVILTLLLSGWLFKEYNLEDPIYDFEVGRFYSIISCYYLWANVMLFICKLEENTEFSGGLIAWVIGLPFIVSIMLSAKKSKVDTLIKSQNKFSSGEEVWGHIRYVLQLISQADTNKNSYMLLIGYIEKHKETCKLTDCYFKQSRKSANLELEDLKRGLIIELDKMFRIGLRKFGSSASLRIFYALFLMERRNNKNDAFLQFSLISLKSKPKLFQQFITYRYMKIIKDKSDDVVDAIENKNNKSELYKKMKMSALYYKAFWAELKEDQPNLVRLMSIGTMITKVSNQVIEKHNEMTKKSSLEFTDLKVLTNFYNQIFNDQYTSTILKKMYRQAKLQIKLVDDEDILESTPQPFLQVSSRKSEVGKIVNLNSLFTTYFGYQKEELRGKSINVLMPKVYADQHDHYLMEFFDNMLINMQFEGDYPRTYLDQEQIQFFKHRNGYIVPFIYKVTFNIDLLHYMAVFKSDPTFKGQPVFIVNANTQIYEMSSGAIQHFDIELRHLKQGVLLNEYFPDILNQNGKHITYSKGEQTAYFQCSAKEIEITQILQELEQEASKKIVKSGYWVIKLEKLEFHDILGGRRASHFINSARNLFPIQSRQSIQVSSRQSITQKLIHTRNNQTSIDAQVRIDTNFEYDQNLMQYLQELYTEQRYDDYKDMLSQQNDTQTMEKTDYGYDIRTRRLINNQLLNIDEEKEGDFLKILEEEEYENSIFRTNNNLAGDEDANLMTNNQYSQLIIRDAMSQNHKHGKISKFCIYAKIWIDFIALLTALQYYFCSLNFQEFKQEIQAIYQINNEIFALNTMISRVLDLSMPVQYNISEIHSDIYSAAQQIINFDLSLNQEFYHSYFDDQNVSVRIYENSNNYEDMQLSLENAILLITSECLNATINKQDFSSNSIQIILYNFFYQIRDPLIQISQKLYQDVLSQIEYPDLNLLISLLVLFLGTTIGMIRFITLMLEIKADRENVIFLFLEIPQKDVSGLAKKVDKFLKFYNEDLKKLNDCQYDDSSDEEDEQIFIINEYDSKAIEEDNQLQLQLKRKKIIQKYMKNKLKGSKGIIVQFLSIALLTLVFAVYNIISSSNEKSQITFLLPQFYLSYTQIENYGYFMNLYKLNIVDPNLVNGTLETTFTGNQIILQNFAYDLLMKLPELRILYFQTYYGNLCTLVNISNCETLIQGNLQLGIYNTEQYYLYYFLTHNESEYTQELYEIDLSLFKCVKEAVIKILDYELNFMTTGMANTLTIQLILVIIYILILELVISIFWLLFLQKLNTQLIDAQHDPNESGGKQQEDTNVHSAMCEEIRIRKHLNINYMYLRQKYIRPQTTSNMRPLDNSALKISKQFTTPKMPRDREMLYDENIKLKGQMNELAQQLIQSKSRVSQLEKELQRFENLIEGSLKPCSQNLEKHALMLKMKNRQKELLLDLQSKNKELSDLKRSLRYTNYQELEVELKGYIDETIRLRQQLEYNQQMVALQSSGQPLEQKILHLEKTLKILQRDNQELAEKQQNNDQIQQGLQIKLDESTIQNERHLSDILKYEQAIKELTEYNKQCNDLILKLQQNNKVQVNINSDELQKNQLLLETAQSKHLQELETKNVEVRQLKTEVQRLKLENEQMEKIIESQEDKIRELESCAYSPISKVGQIDSPLQNGLKIMQIEMKNYQKKKLPKVQYTDIRDVCMRIRLNLVKNKVPSSDIEKYFSESEEMTIHQIKNALHRPPFDVQDHESIKLVARYLVEDNSEDYVIYDQEKSNSTAVIRSVLKKILGKYEIYSPEEEQEILHALKQKLNPSIMETIQMMTAKTQNPQVCESSHFDQALKFHEIQLTQREQEKLSFIIFEISNSLDTINYQQLFAYFK